MIYSKSPPSSSSWRECCQHEEEIAILQEKLMEIHNKLIDQLDVCKEQELTIIQLTNKINDKQPKSNNFDTFKYQSFGQHSHDSFKENQTPNYKVHYNHDSRDSYQAKTELLQADLEAMRGKVLAEITEKNKLKEEVKEIRNTYKKENSALSRKIEGLESLLGKIKDQNEQLRDRCERVRRDNRSQSELEKVANRLGQMEARFLKERDNNREITQQNIQLTEKLDQLQRELLRERESRKDKRVIVDSISSSGSQQYKITPIKMARHADFREEDYVKERQRERQKERQRERDKERDRQRNRERDRIERVDKADRIDDKLAKKRGFQQTKQLIKRLEEAQVNMRKNRKQPI